MREAKVNDQIVRAGLDAPDRARCPECDAPVTKRKRRRMDGSVTYFYCHDRGEGEHCPLRYSTHGR